MLTIIPSPFFIPFESIKLGRLITDVSYPYQGHHDPPCIQTPKCFITQRSSYTASHHNVSNRGFASVLTSLMATGFSKRAKVKVGITTDCVKTYMLDNSDAWFEEAVQTPATRRWMERAVERGDQIYLIVGFHTATNARIFQQHTEEGQVKGQISLSISLLLPTVGAIAPLGNLIDSAVGIICQDVESAQSQFMAPGEQICALQYRRVCHKWLSSRAIDTSRLSGTRWSYVADDNHLREYEDEEEDGEEDVIEVGLQDLDALGGEWEVEQVPGGDLLLVHM